MRPSISLVVPAYNEEAGLSATVERCLKTLRACADDYELIILDDCSRDRTPDIMEQIRQTDPTHIRTARHAVNLGIAATFEDLYRMSTKEYVFLTPGDGEYPPEALLDCAKLIPEYDIVACVRTAKNYTVYRQIVSYCYRLLPLILFGVDLRDPGGTKCMRRSIITDTPVICRSVFVEAERVIRAVRSGKKLAMVEIRHEVRAGGKARGARLETVLRAASDVWRLRWDLWMHPNRM